MSESSKRTQRNNAFSKEQQTWAIFKFGRLRSISKWTDEKWFCLNRAPNKQNERYWTPYDPMSLCTAGFRVTRSCAGGAIIPDKAVWLTNRGPPEACGPVPSGLLVLVCGSGRAEEGTTNDSGTAEGDETVQGFAWSMDCGEVIRAVCHLRSRKCVKLEGAVVEPYS